MDASNYIKDSIIMMTTENCVDAFVDATLADDWEGSPVERVALALFDLAEIKLCSEHGWASAFIQQVLDDARVSLRMIEHDHPEITQKARAALDAVARAIADGEPLELVAAVARRHVGPIWRGLAVS